MALQSLHFNGHDWSVFRMSADAWLLQLKRANMDLIHQSSSLLKTLLGDDLEDIVVGPNSITIFTNLESNKIEELLPEPTAESSQSDQKDIIEIPICYELGTDLEMVASHCGLTHEAVIQQHLAATYRCAFIGFLPGFIYANGLPKPIHCPRKAVPEKRLPQGSIGIGGEMTGIYSLSSPGGWNIIGRTPIQTFQPEQMPPILIEAGQPFRFKRISQEDFHSWPS